MKLKLLAVLNKEKGSGMAINGLAQMCLGLGHRLLGRPDVEVVFGTTQQVRDFRALAVQVAAKAAGAVVYRDFPNTMEGGNMDELFEVVINTPEEAVIYHAACVVGQEIDPRLLAIADQCQRLSGYTPYLSDETAHLLPPHTEMDYTRGDFKTTTLLSKKPLREMLNAVVLANLEAGYKIPFPQLHLLTVGRLTHISYNTHPVLKAESDRKHQEMTAAAGKISDLFVVPYKDLVTVAFGDRKLAESVILRKQTRAYNDSFEKEGLPAATPSALAMHGAFATMNVASGDEGPAAAAKPSVP